MKGASTPIEAVMADASINWKHIDGPLLSWCGLLHWLTLKERFLLLVGLTNANRIADSRFGRSNAMLKARGGA